MADLMSADCVRQAEVRLANAAVGVARDGVYDDASTEVTICDGGVEWPNPAVKTPISGVDRMSLSIQSAIASQMERGHGSCPTRADAATDSGHQ